MARSLVESGDYRVTSPLEALAEYHPPDDTPKLVHFLVRRVEGRGLGTRRLGLTFNLPYDVEEDFDRAQIGGSRAVDQLGDDRFALGDFATLTILSNNDALVERINQQRLEVFRAARPASGIAGLAFRKVGMAGPIEPGSSTARSVKLGTTAI